MIVPSKPPFIGDVSWKLHTSREVMLIPDRCPSGFFIRGGGEGSLVVVTLLINKGSHYLSRPGLWDAMVSRERACSSLEWSRNSSASKCEALFFFRYSESLPPLAMFGTMVELVLVLLVLLVLVLLVLLLLLLLLFFPHRSGFVLKVKFWGSKNISCGMGLWHFDAQVPTSCFTSPCGKFVVAPLRALRAAVAADLRLVPTCSNTFLGSKEMTWKF